MSRSKIKGLDKLQRQLKELQRKAEAVGGQHSVSFDELFTASFLTRYTNFTSVEDMIQQSGYKVETSEDFQRIPDSEWDDFIANNTQFSNWQEMLSLATQEWLGDVWNSDI